MSVVADKFFNEDDFQKVYVAGAVLDRPKLPATRAIPQTHMAPPKRVKVESGVKPPATKPTYGHVRVLGYPKALAGPK